MKDLIVKPRFYFIFLFTIKENYNLAPQTASRFASSPTNCQRLDSGPSKQPKRFKNAHFVKICL
jgi:hypothetical protein